MKREPRKQWSGVLVRDGRAGRKLTASTHDKLVETGRAVVKSWRGTYDRVEIQGVKCRCLECDDGGGVLKNVGPLRVRVNCPACKGKKSMKFDPVDVRPKRKGARSRRSVRFKLADEPPPARIERTWDGLARAVCRKAAWDARDVARLNRIIDKIECEELWEYVDSAVAEWERIDAIQFPSRARARKFDWRTRTEVLGSLAERARKIAEREKRRAAEGAKKFKTWSANAKSRERAIVESPACRSSSGRAERLQRLHTEARNK